MKTSSYTSASALPAKLFCDSNLISQIKGGYIPPAHIQLNPTNKCPGNCSFCSCRHRDRSLVMPFEKMLDITKRFIDLGTKAVTITGGGEPLMHPDIERYIGFCREVDLEVGLTTEGTLLDKVSKETLLKLSWCRISLHDHKKPFPALDLIYEVPLDWSFSYVFLSDNLDARMNFYSYLVKANACPNITHVRAVTDILARKPINLQGIRENLEGVAADMSKVIWQDRQTYTRGQARCLISLLKPNITPSGHLVPCCGVQYMSDPPMLDWPRKLYMRGTIEDIYKHQWHYDGSECVRCYYSEYNTALAAIQDSDRLNHKAFI